MYLYVVYYIVIIFSIILIIFFIFVKFAQKITFVSSLQPGPVHK